MSRDIAEPAKIRWEQQKRKLLPYAYLSPTLLLLAALTVVPIVTVFLYSLFDNVIVNPNPPEFVGLENYVEVLSHRKFRAALSNTLYFASVSVIAHFVIGLSFALLLNSRLLGANVKALFPRHLHSALGLHRVNHRHSLASAVESARRGQLCSA